MLDIIYFSNITENTHRFITKAQHYALQQNTSFNINRIPIISNTPYAPPKNPYILLTPSYGTAKTSHVPPQVKRFLHNPNNTHLLQAVIGTGNMNFGHEYAAAATKIAQKFNIPLLQKVELAGMDEDIHQLYKILLHLHHNPTLLPHPS